MKITQIDVCTVVVPVFPESVHSEEYGGYPDWARVPKQIIRMHTDEGITGIGETGRGQSTEVVAQAAEQLKGRGRDEDVFAERLSHRSTQAKSRIARRLGNRHGTLSYGIRGV